MPAQCTVSSALTVDVAAIADADMAMVATVAAIAAKRVMLFMWFSKK
jgi:hypothetical protein